MNCANIFIYQPGVTKKLSLRHSSTNGEMRFKPPVTREFHPGKAAVDRKKTRSSIFLFFAM